MSMVEGLLNQLAVRGLRVEHRGGDTLVLCGPDAEKTPEVLAAVKAFKKDLLEKYRPRDYGPAADVHHAPPPGSAVSDGPENCVKCKSHVWDPEETGLVCDDLGCPYRGR